MNIKKKYSEFFRAQILLRHKGFPIEMPTAVMAYTKNKKANIAHLSPYEFTQLTTLLYKLYFAIPEPTNRRTIHSSLNEVLISEELNTQLGSMALLIRKIGLKIH